MMANEVIVASTRRMLAYGNSGTEVMKVAVQVPSIGNPNPRLIDPVRVPFPIREELSVPDQSACPVKALPATVPVKLLTVPDTSWSARLPIHVAVALTAVS
jgi:hypothetical protein